MAKKKEKRPWIVTPVGRINYPYIVKPDVGREYSDGKYHTDILFSKEAWKEEGKQLMQAVVLEARKFFQNDKLMLKDFKHPFKDGDKTKDTATESGKPYKDMFYITPKAQPDYPPAIVGPHKVDGKWVELSETEANKIKSGDYCRLVVDVYPYTQSGGGISLGLKTVQFLKSGEPFGTSGRQASINMLGDLPEDILADLDLGDEEEESSEEGTEEELGF